MYRILLMTILIATVTWVTGLAQSQLRRNGKIGFTSDRDGNREIYVMNADGTNPTRLTNNSIVDDHPKWSPDGRKIAFLSQRTSGHYAIFVMNADGAGKTEVTPVVYNPGLEYTFSMGWSPDGTQIVFSDAGTVSIVNADGANRRTLTSGAHPAWSPDGSKILLVRPTGELGYYAYTIRPDGTQLQYVDLPLPDPQWLRIAGHPTWSPDGAKIAFNVTDYISTSGICIANADGSNAQLFGYEHDRSPAWSPNGRSIAFDNLVDGEISVRDAVSKWATQLTNTIGSNFNPDWQTLPTPSFDYDGDGKTDFSVWRYGAGFSSSKWYIAESGSGQMRVSELGGSHYALVPADYDGDGITDIAAARHVDIKSSALNWWVLTSSTNTLWTFLEFGHLHDRILPGDYDGDGKADAACWHKSGGTWHILLSQSGSEYTQQWGVAGDKPVPADFDGDGKAELAVWRPSEGRWYIANPTTGAITVVNWGVDGDIPVVGDYNGDGRADFAVYRPSNDTWYIRNSSDNSMRSRTWGVPGDIVTPGDYDGDGRMDLAVFRPSEGKWYVLTATNNIITRQFGQDGDIPTPASFIY